MRKSGIFVVTALLMLMSVPNTVKATTITKTVVKSDDKGTKKTQHTQTQAVMRTSDPVTSSVKPKKQASKKVNSKYSLTMRSNTPVVNVNGVQLKNWKPTNKKAFFKNKNGYYLKAGVLVNWTDQYQFINGREYLNLGNGGYVNTENVFTKNGSGIMTMARNSYVYDVNGKRIKNFHGTGKLLKGMIVNHVDSLKAGKGKYYVDESGSFFTLPYLVINGKDYFEIEDGGYVRSDNVKSIAGYGIYTSKPIQVRVNTTTKLYHPVGKKMVAEKKVVKKGQILTVDKLVHVKAMDNSDPAQFYRIKGTNNYVPFPDIDILNMDMEAKKF